jgi:pyridoxamine 5'-phosphate oxidase
VDPIAQFTEWLAEAKNCSSIVEPTAMALATADKNGEPSLRIVLLKEASEKGFVFYTNLESHKGHDLNKNPKAALCFYWGELKKQVRVEGIAEPVSAEEADAYFASRPRDSQLGAWASKQSRPLDSKAELIKEVALTTAKFLGRDVPRPPHWSGWRVVPHTIEFWQEGAFRLHDRDLYTRDHDYWKVQKLYP